MASARKQRGKRTPPKAATGRYLWLAGLLVAVAAAYWNHFGNTFHFDDSHTVVDNPAIRSIANIPRFFADATTFSVEPAHQTYRPLVTASLAIDYALSGGLAPFWFHLSTFFWFLVQLLLMYALYVVVLDSTRPMAHNWWLAWFAVALYGLHPASAETVNYIVQRGDLYSTLGVVAGVVVYAWKPNLRRFGLYLVPALAGMLAKPSGLVFAPILAAYIFVVELADRPRRLVSTVHSATPALILSAAYWYFQKIMTPPTNVYAAKMSAADYWITQPYVTLRYFRSFFLPFYLKLDTDLQPLHSLRNGAAIAGVVFCLLLLGAAVFTAFRQKWRAVSFGLWWFLIGLLPTALQPLDEVENDHRMFLPFVGLSLGVVCTSRILAERWPRLPIRRLATCGLIILAGLAAGTHRRNELWHTEESLWRDNIAKSPNNARAHYGLALDLQKQTGHVSEVIDEYRAALRIKPDYVEARANLGSLLGDLPGRLPEAIAEYEAGLRITPDSAALHNNLGAALAAVPGRSLDAVAEYRAALRIDPNHAKAHINLGNLLAAMPGHEQEAITEYEAALRIDSNCAECRNNLGAALSKHPEKMSDAIWNYREAIRLKPDFAEAHYNLAAALAQMPGNQQEEIAECEAALRLKPDLAEARNALERLTASRSPKGT